MVNGMNIEGSNAHDKSICKACLEGKQHRNPILTKSNVENPRVLHQTYSDVCGPMETMARSSYRYFVTFIDAYSHHLVVKLVKTKDEVFGLTKSYFERAEVESGERPNYFRSDGGGEYGSKEFQSYLESKGIHHEKTNAYTPQENGVAERMNRTIVEMARTMLRDVQLPNSYWGDAILYSAHILNRVPTRAIPGDVTPHEAFTGNKSSVAHIRAFGCTARVHIPDEKQ
jgi:transposase InsO family protein